MHDLEPHSLWQEKYTPYEDSRSPFFDSKPDDSYYRNKIYNYLIHPAWDEFGSSTLYMKLLYAHYEKGFAIIELIGEWNDCLYNDIMHLKREIIDALRRKGIIYFVLICENVLNFHGGDDDYYAEWQEDLSENDGWFCFINLLPHVEEEMNDTRLFQYATYGEPFNHFEWRLKSPKKVFKKIRRLVKTQF